MHDQNNQRNLADHMHRGASGAQRATALLWTIQPRSPLPPHPRWAKGQNDHLFVFREHSCHAWWHHCAANMYWEKRDDKESHDFYHGFTCDGHAVHLFDHQY